MAIQGTFYGTTSNVRITPIITWSAVQSVAGNYSDVTATLSYTKVNSNPTTEGYWDGSLTINGNTKNASAVHLKINQNVITKVMTHTVRVNHDSLGMKTITISASGGVTNPQNSTLKSTDISATVVLTAIPRASSIRCDTVDIGKAPTITITRADPSLTHTVNYHFGSVQGTVVTKTKNTTITNWVLPDSFYAQIPGDTKGVGTLTCVTFSGDTQVGTSTCKLYATTDEAVCKPTLTATVEDTNSATVALTGDKNILVRYQSNARCTITATGNKSATITQKTINGTAVSGTTRTVNGVEAGEFLFRTKDSRGYTAEKTVTKTVVPYVNLTSRPVARRTDQTGSTAQLRFEGTFFNGSFGAVKNALTIKYRKTGASSYTTVTPTISGNSYTATVNLTGLDYTQSFSYDVVVADKLITKSQTVTLSRGVPVFDLGANDFRFNVPVYLEDGRRIRPFSTTVVNAGGNADDAFLPGIYRVAENVQNYPFASGGMLVSFGIQNVCCLQIASSYDASSLLVRACWYGTWRDWRNL